MQKQIIKNLVMWAIVLSPAILVSTAGLFVFKQAILTSISSSSHPELVYLILGSFCVGIILTTITLARYTVEGNFLSCWNETPQNVDKQLLLNSKPDLYFTPIYNILLGIRPLAAGKHQAVLEQEIAIINERLQGRLTLPNFIAGALVGLGLVGTFIGLLGTLEDLGQLFAGLAQSGNGNINPTDLFADMVRRLQDPMRGMGTAFIASLYGLMGSLVLGLQILLVSKVGHALNAQMHALIRHSDAGLPVGGVVAIQENAALVKIDGPAVLQILQAAQAAQAEQSKLWEALTIQMRLQQERSQDETQFLRRDIVSVMESTKALSQSVRESIEADDRYRKSVPRTSYWQDAWVKVQAYLQRSNVDQTLAELSRVNRMQSQALLDISSALNRIDQRLSTHLQAQLTK